MQTPLFADNRWHAVSMGKLLRDTGCCVGLLGRAGTWSRGPACGDGTVQARLGTAHDHGAPCPAPRSHPSAKADRTCSALRGTWRPISCMAAAVEPQLARNLARHHPESLMNYPG